MTTATIAPADTTYRVPLSVRGAQAVLLVPLGLVQLVATVFFSITMGWHGLGDTLVGSWAPVMACCCVAVALRLGRRRAALLRAALGLLAAQAAFSVVKLVAYHESASLVFFALIATGAGLLALPASRRHFLG
jgi:hypothetical protein